MSVNNARILINVIHIRKKIVNISLYVNDMNVHVEVTKKTIKSLINIRSEISEVSGYIVNIESSITFLCIISKMSLDI